MNSNNTQNKTETLRRRDFLAATAALPLAALLPEAARGQAAQTSNDAQIPGLILREKMPENLEYPFASLNSFATPNDRFFIRSHFPVPTLDPQTWRLRVEGAVRNPLELTYDDLLKMPQRTVPATLECAGNSRVFLSPAPKGAQWQLGAVSHADWTGVPLAAILERAGVRPDAVEVVLEGSDSGEIKDPPKPSGAIRFARSLPLSRARRPEVVLAYRMNGAELPASHGYPLRAIVPGWYGVASVKWLSRLIVTERPYNGYFQTIDYAVWEEANGLKTRVPITEMQIKAEIARPAMDEVVAAGSAYRVIGAAWTGDSEIVKVEFSADNGVTWERAKLTGTPVRNAWRFWETAWRVPEKAGRYTLMARATDARGQTQAMARQTDRENYLINHVLPIDVIAR